MKNWISKSTLLLALSVVLFGCSRQTRTVDHEFDFGMVMQNLNSTLESFQTLESNNSQFLTTFSAEDGSEMSLYYAEGYPGGPLGSVSSVLAFSENSIPYGYGDFPNNMGFINEGLLENHIAAAKVYLVDRDNGDLGHKMSLLIEVELTQAFADAQGQGFITVEYNSADDGSYGYEVYDEVFQKEKLMIRLYDSSIQGQTIVLETFDIDSSGRLKNVIQLRVYQETGDELLYLGKISTLVGFGA